MALRNLSLRDFVIVPKLELELESGFTGLTGETGAGKSILIDALQLVLGARADALWIREGQPRCEIGAEFDCPPEARTWVEEHGFDSDSETLLLRRVIDAGGKSRAWVNGSPATVTQLRELGEQLVDIHGQHAWQSLTRPTSVRALLDAYASVDTTALTAAWQAWRSAETTLTDARAAQQTLAQERERLMWQLGELDKLSPGANEWEELNSQHSRLSHAQALIDAAQAASEALESDEGGGLQRLAEAQHTLDELRGIEPEFQSVSDVLDACLAQARDVVHSLHAYLRRAEPDPTQLAALDERMGQWLSLARRYRHPPEELSQLHAGWRTDLQRLDAAADLGTLEAASQQARATYQARAGEVSALRRKAGQQLAREVSSAMQELGMQGGRFEVALEPLAEPASHGLESIVFLVAGHAGGTARPVDRVASGGELSRLALAIAVTTSQLGSAPTLVFDEVDSGVGGAVAATVGRLLRRLGQDRQVLCVTHLPQVAACADHHLLVSKQGDQDGITSTVGSVNGEPRVDEIARMLGGERISETTRAHAREMLAVPEMVSPAPPAPAPSARPRKVRA
ncbi:DNA repair protein RecN [Ottowia thiooxydans]|uniref:DNA repair protein RecN n=1 Tax=Ottowia thiooxydans TaxID=219182 RepID=UPI00040C7448|nr:DNA repair protein RecN [Ottowia thiooxydans]